MTSLLPRVPVAAGSSVTTAGHRAPGQLTVNVPRMRRSWPGMVQTNS
jgi:hypothetical protein